jgi:CRISPR-associated protein Cmr3
MTQEQNKFKYLITIEPLGLLYGSSGRFLSPENLVGRSGTHFPPSTATLAGLISSQLAAKEQRKSLELAGPFWAKNQTPQDFYVPTPLHCIVEKGNIVNPMVWHGGQWKIWDKEKKKLIVATTVKSKENTWICIKSWAQLASHDPECFEPIPVAEPPWEYLPHLHPRLKHDERRVDAESSEGSLFLENAIQLDPDTCLVYLSSQKIEDGWYRFGGEGHMVSLQCHEAISKDVQKLLNQPVGKIFSTITPSLWGSNRLSYRVPKSLQKGTAKAARHDLPVVDRDLQEIWSVETMITQRPHPFRYRLGDRKNKSGHNIHELNQPKLLSRGRYAVPAGSVYVLHDPIGSWHQWPDDWFPKEGISLKRLGCGLALPLQD